MHSHDERRFAELMAALALAFGVREKFDTPRLQLYWTCLRDIPLEHVEAGIKEAMQHAEHFPTIGVLRGFVDRAVQSSMSANEDLGIDRRTGTEPYCAYCGDSGFEPDHCDAEHRCEKCLTRMTQVADYEPASHSFLVRCRCRGRNPVLQQRLKAGRRYHRAKDWRP